MHKIRDIPNDALFVTADVVGLYASIPHEAGLQALKEVLERRKDKKIWTNDLVKMAAFVLKNNDFEFDAHPDHTKRSIVFSQALRVSRICSNKTDFERHLDDMKSWSQARGYPKHLV